jgi:hypothetical protein
MKEGIQIIKPEGLYCKDKDCICKYLRISENKVGFCDRYGTWLITRTYKKCKACRIEEELAR